MKIERERKFLVTAIEQRLLAEILDHGVEIVQGYLSIDPLVRVRVENNERGFLTIKFTGIDGRLEFEYEIPVEDARILFKNHQHYLIKKIRCKNGRFEIDIFRGRLNGLVIAEVELDSWQEQIEIPAGLAAMEVTCDKRFENQNLAKLDKLPEGWRCKIEKSL